MKGGMFMSKAVTVNGLAHVNTKVLSDLIGRRVTAKKCGTNTLTISTKGGFTKAEAEMCAIALGGVYTGSCIKVHLSNR